MDNGGPNYRRRIVYTSRRHRHFQESYTLLKEVAISKNRKHFVEKSPFPTIVHTSRRSRPSSLVQNNPPESSRITPQNHQNTPPDKGPYQLGRRDRPTRRPPASVLDSAEGPGSRVPVCYIRSCAVHTVLRTARGRGPPSGPVGGIRSLIRKGELSVFCKVLSDLLRQILGHLDPVKHLRMCS